MTIYSYEIGTTYGGLTNLESLGTVLPAPKSTFKPYSVETELGNGGIRGGGYPVVTWHWGFLKKTQRDMLKTFCSGKSASVYIKTKKQDDTYQIYTAQMIWPTQEETDAGRRIDITVEFRHLVEASS